MAKSKEKKTQLINGLSESLKSRRTAFLVDYQGLKVNEIEEMRGKLREQNILFAVVKNSLLKIALKKESMEIDKELLERPLAIGFADDEVTLSKELTDSAKLYEAMEVLGGYIDKKFVPESTIKELSILPGRDQLYAKLVGSMNAPISGLVNVMAGSIRSLINVLNNYQESLS